MDVFILGVERSATTWLSNILEAHPQTEVFMEPLSKYTSYFTVWPNRLKKISDHDLMADYFRNEFNEIKKNKKFFLTNFSDSGFAWEKDFNIARICLSRLDYKKARNFIELNFHRKDESFSFKKENVNTQVIKELRLNFNSELISKINNYSKAIVVVRNYASNIKSIVKQVANGSLVELRNLLDLKGNSKDYSKLMEYWVESYNNLLEGLEEAGTKYIIVSHEDLLIQGDQEISKIFEFLGLSLDEQVHEYFKYSNKSGEGAHNTNRDHKALLSIEKRASKEMAEYLSGEDIKKIHPKLQALV